MGETLVSNANNVASAYCPNCAAVIAADASTCDSCTAVFGVHAGWSPAHHPDSARKHSTAKSVVGAVLLLASYPLPAVLTPVAIFDIASGHSEIGFVVLLNLLVFFGPLIFLGHWLYRD